MKRVIILLLLAAAPLVSAAGAETRNPDRWFTADLSVLGTSSFKGDQILYSKAPDIDQLERNLNVAVTGLGIFPVADSWTVLSSIGSSWTETGITGNSVLGGNAFDNNLLTYSLGARHYFLDHHVASKDPSENPDRWPSLAATVSGASGLHSSGANAVGNFAHDQTNQNLALALDTRLPVADAWTLTFAASTSRLYSKVNGTATTDSTQLVENDIGASAGVRYFFVGHNLILQDGHQNPDRWTMLSLTLSATSSVWARDTITSPAGVQGQRGKDARSYIVSTQARLPITDHMSLHFDLGTAYNRATQGNIPTPPHSGFLTRLGTAVFGAGLRYFFF